MITYTPKTISKQLWYKYGKTKEVVSPSVGGSALSPDFQRGPQPVAGGCHPGGAKLDRSSS